MDFNELWQKTEKVMYKACDYMEKELERKKRDMRRVLARKTDDELIKIAEYAGLNEIQREVVEEEMQRRRIGR